MSLAYDEQRLGELGTTMPRHSSDAERWARTSTDTEKQLPQPEEHSKLVAWDGLNDQEYRASWHLKRNFFVSGGLASLPLIVDVGVGVFKCYQRIHCQRVS